MDWQNYEEITKHIYETLGKAHGVMIDGYGKDCKIKGKSSVEHQIDVLTSHSDGIHSYKTMIECKYWDQNVNKDTIMKVAEIVEDAGLNKGIIVSKNGFTPDAISYAQYRNIGLVELRRPTDKDWEGRLRNISFKMNMIIPKITDVQFLIHPETIPSPNLKAGSYMNVELLSIKKSDGTITPIISYMKQFNSELSQKEENETLEKDYIFDSGTVVIYTPTSEEMSINGIRLNGRLNIAKETFEIKGDDHILMIMRSIFDDKSYTITKDLEVKERKDS